MSAKRDDARLIRNLMDLMDVSPYEAKRLLGIVTTAMADAIRRDEKVRMDGIGWFYPYRKAGYWNNGVAKRGKGRQETYVPDRRLLLPEEEVTIFQAHIIAIQKRNRVVLDQTVEQKEEWKQALKAFHNNPPGYVN